MTQTQLVNISNGVTLTIGTRKKPTPTKPPYFLLLVTPKGDRVYLSSMYPDPLKQAENELQGYRFEVDGVWYTLIIDKGVRQATVILQDCANSINNAQLGSKSDPILDKFGNIGDPKTGTFGVKNPKKGGGVGPETGQIGHLKSKKGGFDGQI